MKNIPYVIEKTADGERGFDILSRLLQDRIICIFDAIDDQLANVVCAQMLYLEKLDPKKDIHLYINSPGGVVTAGFSIFDTMNFIRPDVCTICSGQAASMGAFLLAAGKKGKRYALPNARIMIHQPLGGVYGQVTDIQIQAKEILRLKTILNEFLAKHTGQPVAKIAEDTERDNFMGSMEAKAYGLVDHVISSSGDLPQI